MPGVPHVRDPSTPLWVRGPRVPRGPDRGPGGGDMGWRGAFEGWRGPGRHPSIRDLWSRRFGVHSGATVGRHPRARRFRARSPTRARHTGDGRMGMLGHTAYLFLIRNRIPMKWRRKIDRVCASIACRRRGAHALPKDGDEAREAIARYYTHTRRRGRETRRVGRECFAGNADINLPRRSCPLRSCHSVHAARSMCST